MSNTTASLVIKVDSSGAAKATDNLNRLDRAAGNTERAANKLGKAWGVALGVVSSAVIIGATRAYIQQADAMANMSAKLKLVTGSTEAATKAQRSLFDLSQRTSSDLESTTDLYVKLGQSSKELAGNHELLLGITEKVSKALVISGADAASSAAVIRQFSQAMAAGALRGDEFISVMEGAPRLARALADGLGVPIGSLRKLAAEGKLTIDVIIKALEDQGVVLDREFGEMPLTVGRATAQVKNSLAQLVGETDKASTASGGLATAIKSVATALSDPALQDGFRTAATWLAEMTGKALAATSALLEYYGAVDKRGIHTLNAQISDKEGEVFATQRSLKKTASIPWLGAMDAEALKKGQAELAELEAAREKVLARNAAASKQSAIGKLSDGFNGVLGLVKPVTGSGAGTATGGGNEAVTRATRERTTATKELTLAEQEALLMQQSLRDVGAETLRITADNERATTSQGAATKRFIEDLKFEASLYGLSNVEREKAIALRQAETTATSELGQVIGALVEKREQAREADAYVQDLKGGLGDLFATIGEGSDKASASFDRMIENMKRKAAQALADKAIDGLLAGFAGMAGGGGWAGFKSGFAKGFGGGGNKAAGGPLMAGNSYRVGDGGEAEWFTPSQNGTLTPESKLGGGGASIKNLKIVIENNGQPSKAESSTATQQPDGSVLIKIVTKTWKQAAARGDFDHDMARNFGIRRAGVGGG